MQDPELLETGTEGKVLQLVCFMFADEEYAVDITNVREVVRIQKITHIPQMPDFTLGIINIRGSIIPVFDLRKKFGLREKESDEQSKMIVVDVNDSQICFVVDKILNNVKIAVSSVVPTPNVKMKIKRECIRGIGKFEDRMIIILDLARLNECVVEDIKALNPEAQGGGLIRQAESTNV
jgi:purine-binding chemotaxis protein CheW